MPCLVTVSGLRPEYGLDLQIDAMSRIVASHPKAGLMVIGAGEHYDTIAAQIAGKPYADQILLCNDVEHEETLCAIRDADIFLRTNALRRRCRLGARGPPSRNARDPPPITGCDRTESKRSLSATSTRWKHLILATLDNPPPRVPIEQSGQSNLDAVFQLYQELT